MKKKYRVLVGIMSVILSGCAPKGQEETVANTSESSRNESTARLSTESTVNSATETTTESTKEPDNVAPVSNEDEVSLTPESLNHLLFPNGKSSSWVTEDESLLVSFGKIASIMNFGLVDGLNHTGYVSLPSEFVINQDGSSFNLPLNDYARDAYKGARDQLTIHVGKDTFDYYLELLPLVSKSLPDELQLTRYYFNSWWSTEEAVEVLNKTMDNPNNAAYFEGAYPDNWQEVSNEYSFIEISAVKEQGGSEDCYRLEKLPTTYRISLVGEGGISSNYYKVDRNSYEVLEYKDQME
ncbi:hypothetical protein [Enterococcus sp. AZ109]|uniref:hypothetical protein n=1 Tax=Enterococcus sp. AZ109 TaxID=2774634 RepID=UPI003F25F89A